LKKKKTSGQTTTKANTLILGIGNVLMGDEGIGVHVARQLMQQDLPENVECVDGGTGSFYLLEMMQNAKRVLLIDATIDGQPPGTIRRLQPRFSSEYPRTLTAHDIGLKDLIDAFYLLGNVPDVTLFAISISPDQTLNLDLSPEIEAIIPQVAEQVLAELK
jgi:hydrogenase maturation protease